MACVIAAALIPKTDPAFCGASAYSMSRALGDSGTVNLLALLGLRQKGRTSRHVDVLPVHRRNFRSPQGGRQRPHDAWPQLGARRASSDASSSAVSRRLRLAYAGRRTCVLGLTRVSTPHSARARL